MSSTFSCNICADDYKVCDENPLTKPIVCHFCNHTSCYECSKTYILSQSITKCMNPDCAKEWTYGIMLEKFPLEFVKGEYAKHLKNVLIEKEKAKLPLAQNLLDIKKLNNELDELHTTYSYVRRQKNDQQRKVSLEERIIDVLLKLLEKGDTSFIPRCMHTYIWQERNLDVLFEPYLKGNVVVKPLYPRPCPSLDCKGFLDGSWFCSLCETKVCRKCRTILDNDSHECKEYEVKAAIEMDKKVKPCPGNCKNMIEKLEGCDQMFCTVCHVAFSWTTGEIERKRIHNPHYFEMLRQTGRDDLLRRDAELANGVGNGMCEDEVVIITRNLNVAYRKFVKVDKVTPDYDKFCYIQGTYRNAAETKQYQIDGKFKEDIEKLEDTRELGIKYLTNEYTEKQWQTQMLKNLRKCLYLKEVVQIFEGYSLTLDSILAEYKVPNEFIENICSVYTKTRELVNYTNELFIELSDKYDYNTAYEIDRRTLKKISIGY